MFIMGKWLPVKKENPKKQTLRKVVCYRFGSADYMLDFGLHFVSAAVLFAYYTSPPPPPPAGRKAERMATWNGERPICMVRYLVHHTPVEYVVYTVVNKVECTFICFI